MQGLNCNMHLSLTLLEGVHAVALRRKISKLHDLRRNGIHFPATPTTDRNVGVNLKWQCISRSGEQHLKKHTAIWPLDCKSFGSAVLPVSPQSLLWEL